MRHLLDNIWMTEFFEKGNLSDGSAGHTFCFSVTNSNLLATVKISETSYLDLRFRPLCFAVISSQ